MGLVSLGGFLQGTLVILGMFEMRNLFVENDICTDFLIEWFCILFGKICAKSVVVICTDGQRASTNKYVCLFIDVSKMLKSANWKPSSP